MNRTVVSSLASLFMASTLVAAQGGAPTTPPTTPAPPVQTPPTTTPRTPAPPTPSSTPNAAQTTADKARTSDVTLTGCLSRGSGPNVFILENARTAAQGSSEAGKTYVIAKASGAESLDFEKNLNHKVTITGTAVEASATPATSTSSSSASSPSSSPSSPSSSSSTPSSSSSAPSSSTSSSASGSASASASASASDQDEKDMARFNAKTIVTVADTCTAP